VPPAPTNGTRTDPSAAANGLVTGAGKRDEDRPTTVDERRDDELAPEVPTTFATKAWAGPAGRRTTWR